MDELQFDANGRLRHLITLDGFDRVRIHGMLAPTRCGASRATAHARSIFCTAAR